MVEWLLYGCNAGRPFHLSCQSFFFFFLNLAYLKLHVLGVPTRDWLDFVVVIVGALPLGHHVDVVVEECSKVLRRFLHVIAWLTKRWISCFRNMQHPQTNPQQQKDIQNVCNCKTMEQPDNNNVDHRPRPHHHHPTGGGESLRLIFLYLIYV